jgi:hypothetical protein
LISGEGPIVTYAAPWTLLHEGRKLDLRCGLHSGLLSGTKPPFDAARRTSVG